MPKVLSDRRLTTSAEAETAYLQGVAALRELRHDALEHFGRALALDPTFALAHAAVALVGHCTETPVDLPRRVEAAQLHARRSTPAERRQVASMLRCLSVGRLAAGGQLS